MSDVPTRQLGGKVAVVTGGTQGLGEAIARLFAARGAAGLVICGRQSDKGEAVAADLAGQGCRTVFVRADLGAVDDARAVMAAAERAFGRIDALVNAAGITDRGTIFDTSPELFDRMVAVNLRAPFFLMQEAAKLIRVNALNIGWMNTPGEDRIMRTVHGATDGWLAKAAAEQPFGRLIEPDEVARACAFLCSAESGLMTGAVIDFDQSVAGCYESAPHPATKGER